MVEEEVLWADASDSEDADSLGGNMCSASLPAELYVWRVGFMPDDESRWKLYESCGLGISENDPSGGYESMEVKAVLNVPSR